MSDIERVLISEEEISSLVSGIAQRINTDYADKNPLIICILKGSVIFFSDLVRKLTIPLEFEFMSASSYGNSTQSSGIVKLIRDVKVSVKDRHVLIVEDIVDSGITLSYLLDYMQCEGCASVEVVSLLNKTARRVKEVDIKYYGTDIDDLFVVGYGMDYAERYRNLPYIGILKESVYS